MALKGNQKHIHEAVKNYCKTHCFSSESSIIPTVDYFDDSHGRKVQRRAFVCPEACDLSELQHWPEVRQVLVIETIRQVTNQDQPRCEIRYFLSSSDAPAEKQIQAIRSHWQIENSLHWVLDMSFREDECRIRDANAARCFSILRKIAINLVRQDSTKRNSLKAKRKKAGWSNDYMESVLFSDFRA